MESKDIHPDGRPARRQAPAGTVVSTIPEAVSTLCEEMVPEEDSNLVSKAVRRRKNAY